MKEAGRISVVRISTQGQGGTVRVVSVPEMALTLGLGVVLTSGFKAKIGISHHSCSLSSVHSMSSSKLIVSLLLGTTFSVTSASDRVPPA